MLLSDRVGLLREDISQMGIKPIKQKSVSKEVLEQM